MIAGAPRKARRIYKVPHNATQQNILIKGTILRSYTSAYSQLSSVLYNINHRLDKDENVNRRMLESLVCYIETSQASLANCEYILRQALGVCSKEESAAKLHRKYEANYDNIRNEESEDSSYKTDSDAPD